MCKYEHQSGESSEQRLLLRHAAQRAASGIARVQRLRRSRSMTPSWSGLKVGRSRHRLCALYLWWQRQRVAAQSQHAARPAAISMHNAPLPTNEKED
jgi:hypothetical protein